MTPKGGQALPGQPPPAVGESPIWVPVLMFSFLGLGVLIIFFNYVGWMPGGTSNSILLLGLGSSRPPSTTDLVPRFMGHLRVG